MPRVYQQRAQRRYWRVKDERPGDPNSPVAGAQKPNRKCGRCHREIIPGEQYRSWSFRYGGEYFRCFRPECDPRPSELTQSKMSTVLASIEDVDLSDLTAYEEIEEALNSVADTIDEVAEEYDEAAEALGGAGEENRDRAEQLRGWADEVRQAISSSVIEAPKCSEHEDSEEEGMDCLACDEAEDSWLEEMRDAANDAFAGSPF